MSDVPRVHSKDGILWWGTQRLGEGDRLQAAGEPLGKYLKYPVGNLAPLPGADVCLWTASGSVGIERKTGGDLFSSWMDGHFQEQVSLLRDNYDHSVLILEGFMLAWEDRQFEQLASDLLTMQESGVRFLYTSSTYESAALVESLFARYQRTKHVGLDRRASPQVALYRRALLWVPSWGSVATERALEHFKKPFKVFSASQRGLSEAGVGRAQAKNLWTAIGRKRDTTGRSHG